jgi:hypothetical protein
MKKWEYKTIFGNVQQGSEEGTFSSSQGFSYKSSNEMFLDLGSQGWELVTVVPQSIYLTDNTRTFTQISAGQPYNKFTYYFKRPSEKTFEQTKELTDKERKNIEEENGKEFLNLTQIL